MDAFIAIHGAEHIFIGGRPATADESLKKLYLATGIHNPADFARDSRSRGRLTNKPKPRLMEPSAAVVNIFQDRYLINGPNKMSISNIDKLIDEITAKDVTSQKVQKPGSGLELLRSCWEDSRRLGALQLLAAIKQGLSFEEPMLQFNYFGMHKRCIEVLRLIQAKENHKFVQYFGSGYMPDDTLIANLVILILTVAQRSGVASQQLLGMQSSSALQFSAGWYSAAKSYCMDIYVRKAIRLAKS